MSYWYNVSRTLLHESFCGARYRSKGLLLARAFLEGWGKVLFKVGSSEMHNLGELDDNAMFFKLLAVSLLANAPIIPTARRRASSSVTTQIFYFEINESIKGFHSCAIVVSTCYLLNA